MLFLNRQALHVDIDVLLRECKKEEINSFLLLMVKAVPLRDALAFSHEYVCVCLTIVLFFLELSHEYFLF